MSLIGIHINDIRDLTEIISKNTVYNNLQLVQTFVSSTEDYTDKKYNNVKKYIRNNHIRIAVHGSYSINLARRWDDNDWWIQQFINEIEAAKHIGAFCIVIHTGKKLELSNAEAINNMYTSLIHIHEKTKDHNHVRILLETPSGQGSETLTKIEDLCSFMNKFYKHPKKDIQERFGLCVDTCHVFAAGYDIRKNKDSNIVFGIIDKSIGINKIKLCHINDSKQELGSNRDRHDNIGKGKIGKDTIVTIVKFMNSLEIPMILETPSEFFDDDYIFLTNV